MAVSGARHPALFLDRDGVVNVDFGHVKSPAEFRFVEGIVELCVAARQADYRIVVVTNQAGIARGLYSERQMHELHQWMRDSITSKGAFIDAVYYCPFHPEALVEQFRADSFYRKPNPGMILEAAAELDIDLPHSVLIGDQASDIEAGKRAGIGTLIFFGEGLPLSLVRTSFGFQCGSLRTIASRVFPSRARATTPMSTSN